jgi:hypothetical protein
MEHSQLDRRRFLGGATTGAALTFATGAFGLLASGAARALEAPAGKVILSVTGGAVGAGANDNGAASFDLAMLQKLPAQTFSTKTPWFPQARKFTGVSLQAVLDAMGAAGVQPASVNAIALNDYRVDIPLEDFTKHRAMLAYWVDDKPMTVREKGPLIIIYPFDDEPELRNALHYSRAIWQLRSLELR